MQIVLAQGEIIITTSGAKTSITPRILSSYPPIRGLIFNFMIEGDDDVKHEISEWLEREMGWRVVWYGENKIDLRKEEETWMLMRRNRPSPSRSVRLHGDYI